MTFPPTHEHARISYTCKLGSDESEGEKCMLGVEVRDVSVFRFSVPPLKIISRVSVFLFSELALKEHLPSQVVSDFCQIHIKGSDVLG